MARARDRALLESVIEQMPIGVVIFEPSGRTLVSNREYERIFGRRPPDVINDDRPAFAHRDGSPVATADLPGARALRSGTRVEDTLAYTRDDGTRLELQVWADPVLDDVGGVAAVAMMIEDVTRREVRERAERDFVTNAAHELQSPIAAVIAAAETLQAGAKDSRVERDRFIGHILDACARLSRLTHALLVLARVQTGAEAAKRELVSLSPLLRSIAASTPVAPGVKVRVACAHDIAAIAHRGLLEQALANLVSNAAKHTQSGRISLAAKTLDDRVAITVADTGTGIAAGDQERIRDRFVRLDGDRDGFGLGLAIADQAIRAMDGELRLESEPGRGTSATILLATATVIST